MNLILRFLRVVLHSFFRPKVDFFEQSRVFFHVWPNDIDFNLHLTNSRYLSVMDLGRTDLLIRTGLAKRLWSLKWKPVLGGATIRFRRSLAMWQRYVLCTQIIGWDDKWLYIEQQIKHNGTVIATAMVKAIFVESNRSIPTAVLFQAMGVTADAVCLNPKITAWQAMDAAMGKKPSET